MKKAAKRLVVLTLLAFTLLGCGSQKAQKNSSDIKLYLNMCQMDTFRQTLVDAATEKASEEGVELKVEDAQNSIETQVEQIKTAAEQGYDVILCDVVNTDTIVELKASAGDTPIIFIVNGLNKKYLSKGEYVYVGSKEQVAGEFQAEYILDKMASKDEINVALLKGPKGHSGTAGRTNGVKQVLKQSGKKINYVFEDYANWDTQQAKEMFEIFLKTGSPVDCVICNNDGMALGVVEACKEAGIDLSTLPILGVDATADGCEAIKNNEMAFTVYQSGLGQGQKAVEMAISLANNSQGQEVEGITEDGLYVWVPFEKVDSSNVSEYASK